MGCTTDDLLETGMHVCQFVFPCALKCVCVCVWEKRLEIRDLFYLQLPNSTDCMFKTKVVLFGKSSNSSRILLTQCQQNSSKLFRGARRSSYWSSTTRDGVHIWHWPNSSSKRINDIRAPQIRQTDVIYMGEVSVSVEIVFLFYLQNYESERALGSKRSR